jgi:preprotein translocase subunit SecG
MLGILLRALKPGRRGMASLMLWLIIALVIAIAVVVIIWMLTGKMMSWDLGGFFGGGSSGGAGASGSH